VSSPVATSDAPRLTEEERLAELDRILADEAIVSVYQPIVELATGEIVAYEALARGPIDSPLHMPGDLFGTAARTGRLAQLDWACRASAIRGALGTALRRPTALFVNVEPVASAARMPDHYAEIVQGAQNELNVVYEFTERALTERPGEVLGAVRDLRKLGVSIALDDVGVDPRSLALMPFLRPEIVKLDLSVVQGEASSDMARTMHAVNAHAERSGALILAEGIETQQHLDRARALGATYGQGWFFGRPGPAPTHRVIGATLPQLTRGAARPAEADHDTPFQRVQAAGGTSRIAQKQLLLALSKQLELHARELGPEAVVIASLQHVRQFTPATRARYRDLSEITAFVGVLGEGLSDVPDGGVRGGSLHPGEPLRQEWNVCVVSPHFAAGLVARDLGDDPSDDLGRRFEYCLTYDRDMVVRASRLMMARIAPPDLTA
jgi:EAL domain-containing protein (putative c-di-GMP-specific phosphodiesterase class I)